MPAPIRRAFNPFVAHEFLRALEDSGSATGRNRLEGRASVYETAKGRSPALHPAYVKYHS